MTFAIGWRSAVLGSVLLGGTVLLSLDDTATVSSTGDVDSGWDTSTDDPTESLDMAAAAGSTLLDLQAAGMPTSVDASPRSAEGQATPASFALSPLVVAASLPVGFATADDPPPPAMIVENGPATAPFGDLADSYVLSSNWDVVSVALDPYADGGPYSYSVSIGTEATFLRDRFAFSRSARPDGWLGFDEKWLDTLEGPHLLLPDGSLHAEGSGRFGMLSRFLGVEKHAPKPGALVASLEPIYYHYPEILTSNYSGPTIAHEIAEHFQFRRTAELVRGRLGLSVWSEQWFVDADGERFFLTPTGELYAERGADLSATYLATIHPAFHADPRLLLDMGSPWMPAGVNEGGVLQFGPLPEGMAGPLTAQVQAYGFDETAVRMFRIETGENYPPQIGVPKSHLLGVGETSVPFSAQVTDNDSVSVSARAAGSAAYFLSDRHQFVRSERPDNWGGRDEKWLQSPDGWFYIVPSGTISRWDRTPERAAGEVVARLEPVFYHYPDLLTASSDGSLASILDRRFSFSPTSTPERNSLGLDERWLDGPALTAFVTPDGSLYRADDAALLARFNPIHHRELGRLYAPQQEAFSAEFDRTLLRVDTTVDPTFYGRFVVEISAYDGLHRVTSLVPVERRYVETGALARVSGANAVTNTAVIVAFSEQMNSSVLDPSSYLITYSSGAGSQAVTDVVAVEYMTRFGRIDRSAVRLTTRPMSEVEYTVAVSNVRDLSGAPLAYPIDLSLADPARATFVGRPPDYLDLVDSDGDGLYDSDEQRGWEVRITAADGTVATRWVTSDPNNPDSDSDVLSDYDEFLLNLDPRNPDSDRDHLSDNAEYNEIYSNPAMVDSDEDGIDDFFEWGFYLSSPSDADSDGDQIPDGVEALLANRNIRVADLPQPAIDVGNVNVQVNYVYSYTDEDGTTKTEERTAESELQQSDSKSFSNTDASSHQVAAKVSASYTKKFGPKVGGVEATGTVGVEVSTEHSFSSSFTQESTKASQESIKDAFTAAEEISETQTVERTAESATMKVAVMLRNESNIAYRLQDVQVTAFVQDKRDFGSLVPIATLLPEAEPDDGFTLGPFSPERGPIIFSDDSIFPGMAEELMLDPEGLIFQISNYDIIDEAERNFAFSSQEVNDRTASVVLDFGFGETLKLGDDVDEEVADLFRGVRGATERYRVSTGGGRALYDTNGDGVVDTNDRRVAYDPNTGAGAGITITDAMSVLGLTKYDEAVTPSIGGGLTTQQLVDSYSTRIDEHGVERLWRVRDVSAELTNPLKGWMVFYGNTINPAGDFSDLILDTESRLTLRFLQDLDGDGIDAAQEYRIGSSDSPELITIDPKTYVPGPGNEDLLPAKDTNGDGEPDSDPYPGHQQMRGYDTDLDGLSDSFEYFGGPVPLALSTGWLVDPVGRDAYRGFSSPARADSDLDGVPDNEEYNRFIWTGDEQRRTPCDNPAASNCIRLSSDARSLDTDGDGVTDGDEIRGFVVELRGGGTVYVTTDPLSPDTDGDTLTDGAERKLGSNPVVNDAGSVLDDDGDGLVNFQENQNDPDSGWLVTYEYVVGTSRSYRSIPFANDVDSDDDGLSDFEEFELRTDPRNPDTDRDLLSDSDEVNRGSDPLDQDTDDDGLTDGLEVNGWSVRRDDGFDNYKSDPLQEDADNDLLIDSQEKRYGTDPTNDDTDEDGVKDGHEIAIGTDPTTKDQKVTVTLLSIEVVGPVSDESGGLDLRGKLKLDAPRGSDMEITLSTGWDNRNGGYKKDVSEDGFSRSFVMKNRENLKIEATGFKDVDTNSGDDTFRNAEEVIPYKATPRTVSLTNTDEGDNGGASIVTKWKIEVEE